MKEQIIKILDGPIGKMIGVDKLWEAIEELVNQEVERHIAERMPTVDDAENAQLTYEHKQTDCLDRFSYIHCYRDFMAGIEWLRSRMTNDSQKTEGGGE